MLRHVPLGLLATTITLPCTLFTDIAKAQPCVEITDPQPLNGNAASDDSPDWGIQLTNDGQGTWGAVWYSWENLNGTISDDLDIFWSRSVDDAATWSEPQALNTNAAFDVGADWQPHVITDGAGTWVAAWSSWDDLEGTIGTDPDILFARSVDNGVTWAAPQPLNTDAQADAECDFLPLLATDESGSLLTAWHHNACSWPRRDRLRYSIGFDEGTTWSPPLPLYSQSPDLDCSEYCSQIAVDSFGRWLVFWSSCDSLDETIGNDLDILTTQSADGGATWSFTTAFNTNAESDSGVDSAARIASDRAGHSIAVWESNDDLEGAIGEDSDILVSRSTDDGETWSLPAPLNSNAALDAGRDLRPQISTDEKGAWIVVWDSDDDLEGSIGDDRDILYAISTNWGETWTDPTPVNSTAASDGHWDDDRNARLSLAHDNTWVVAWESSYDLNNMIGTDYDLLFARVQVVGSDCLCSGDLDDDNAIGAYDLALLLGDWGACSPKGDCPADFDEDGVVGLRIWSCCCYNGVRARSRTSPEVRRVTSGTACRTYHNEPTVSRSA